MLDVILHPDRDRSVRRRHPWVLSGAVREVRGDDPQSGAWARVISADGQELAYGHYAPESAIRVRLLAFGASANDAQEAGLIEKRVARAIARRADDALLAGTDAMRLVNAEGDGLPGLIVDRYADGVVLKLGSAGMDARREQLAEVVREASGASFGFERADGANSRREGIAANQGSLWGAAPPKLIPVRENERLYEVDVVEGQKTGFYLDQRDARDLVQQLASGRRMLDLFSYTGAFSVAAARGGASQVTLVDSSVAALERASAHLALNVPDCEATVRRSDANAFLRQDKSEYDLIVADPPPLARRRSDVQRATRAYKDLLIWSLRRAAPGALLLAFTCSSHIASDLFRKVVFAAALDAQKSPQLLRTLGASVDHPVSIDHPEGEYLRGLLLRV